jgi:hypothetical protein
MNLTAGERRALWCLVPVVLTFLPPVTTWAAGVERRVFGVPFLIFWSAASIVMTAGWMTLAFRLKQRVDGNGSS